MGAKRALVVDDSRSARLVLKRQLIKHGIEVDEAASAEDALEYLLHNKPHAIFMDHMMPGMDGFEAVRIIKANPTTALIPIMMYTSKEGGELYLGQARALGAVGVLPKEVQSVDLVSKLNSLHLLEPTPDNAPLPVYDTQPFNPAKEIAALAREAADETMIELLQPHLEAQSRRLHTSIQSAMSSLLEELREPVEPPPARRWPAALGGMLLGAVLVLGGYKLMLEENTTAPSRSSSGLADTAPAPSQLLLGALAQQRTRGDQEKASLLKAVEWSMNREGEFPLGATPFDDQRLSAINELVQMLHQGGFQGSIHLTAHAGNFCMVEDARGDLALAPDTLALTACVGFGSEASRLQRSGQLESTAFASFANRTPLLAGSPIRLVIEPPQDNSPRVEYPIIDGYLQAGDWNAIARQNQRVEVRLQP
ncbi:MAG: PleD family two-component system response regulator [Pseudomonas sp.]